MEKIHFVALIMSFSLISCNGVNNFTVDNKITDGFVTKNYNNSSTSVTMLTIDRKQPGKIVGPFTTYNSTRTEFRDRSKPYKIPGSITPYNRTKEKPDLKIHVHHRAK